MTEPTRKPQPRTKTRVKNLGGIKASLVAVSMALTVGGWAVLARDDSLVLSQTAPQAGIEQSAPAPIRLDPSGWSAKGAPTKSLREIQLEQAARAKAAQAKQPVSAAQVCG